MVSAVPRAVSESDLSVFELEMTQEDWDFLSPRSRPERHRPRHPHRERRGDPGLSGALPRQQLAELPEEGLEDPHARRRDRRRPRPLEPHRRLRRAHHAAERRRLRGVVADVDPDPHRRVPPSSRSTARTAASFSNLEQIGERFLDRYGLDPNSSLYRVIDSGMQLLGSEAEYMEAFEKKTNLAEGYDDIIAFVELVNNTSDADFPSTIASVLDVDTWLDWYSTQILLENDDFTHRDHFYYWDPSINKWTMFVWDMDSILTINPNQYILTGTQGHEDTSGWNVLVDRMMDVPQFREAFALKILNGLQTFFTQSEMNALIDDTYAVAVEDALRDRWKLDQLRNARYAQRPGELKEFVAARIAYLEEAVEEFLPDNTGGLVINEFMTTKQRHHRRRVRGVRRLDRGVQRGDDTGELGRHVPHRRPRRLPEVRASERGPLCRRAPHHLVRQPGRPGAALMRRSSSTATARRSASSTPSPTGTC